MRGSMFFILRAIIIFISALLLVINYFGYDVNIIGVMVLSSYLLALFIYRPIEYANNLLFFIILIPMLIGGMLIERGTYLFEIDKYTYRNGTFLVNLFFSLIFIEFLIRPIQPSFKNSIIKIDRFLVEGVIIFSIVALYAAFINTGVPIINGIHRSVYFSSMVPDYINLIKGRLTFVCMVLGLYLFRFKEKRYVLYFLLIVIYHILCSIKGGELLMVIYSFYLPITLFYAAKLTGKDRDKISNNVRLALIFLLGSLFSLILFNYQTVENYDNQTTAIEKIEKRVEAAGQIWWVINDESQVDSKLRMDSFLRNFRMEDNNIGKGMNQLMDEAVPNNILNAWRQQDTRGRSLANGFPAIGFYYFGYVGVIVFIMVLGGIIIFIKKDILAAFESGDVISFLFIAPIMELAIRVVAQGDIYLFFEKRTYAIIFSYVLYGVIKDLMVRAKSL
ncbi:DUF6418 domain-containing protein [Aeromonas sp. sif2433]|uniref:DUF6418 domain-containing protein n=1 Tax=Aeromonas sp. sif2433 TaxID=2854794 RepID=UPI001C494DA5|nr:hypothetical protein [Aeromonas sp. sif2433]